MNKLNINHNIIMLFLLNGIVFSPERDARKGDVSDFFGMARASIGATLAQMGESLSWVTVSAQAVEDRERPSRQLTDPGIFPQPKPTAQHPEMGLKDIAWLQGQLIAIVDISAHSSGSVSVSKFAFKNLQELQSMLTGKQTADLEAMKKELEEFSAWGNENAEMLKQVALECIETALTSKKPEPASPASGSSSELTTAAVESGPSIQTSPETVRTHEDSPVALPSQPVQAESPSSPRSPVMPMRDLEQGVQLPEQRLSQQTIESIQSLLSRHGYDPRQVYSSPATSSRHTSGNGVSGEINNMMYLYFNGNETQLTNFFNWFWSPEVVQSSTQAEIGERLFELSEQQQPESPRSSAGFMSAVSAISEPAEVSQRMQAEIVRLSAELQSTKSMREEYELHTQELIAQMTEMSQELEKLREEKGQIEKLQDEKRAQEAEVNRLEALKKDLEAQISEITQKADEEQKQLKDKIRDTEALKKQAEEAAEELSQKAAKLQELQARFEEVDAQKACLEAALSEATRHASVAAEQARQAESAMRTEQDQEDDKKQSEAVQTIAKLQESILTLQAEKEGFEALLLQAEERKQVAEKALSEAMKEIDRLQDPEQSDKAVEDEQVELERGFELLNLRSTLKMIEEKKALADARVAELEGQLEEVFAKNNETLTTQAQLLQELIDQKALADARVAELQAALVQAQNSAAARETDLSEERRRIEGLQARIEELNSLAVNQEALLARITALEAELKEASKVKVEQIRDMTAVQERQQVLEAELNRALAESRKDKEELRKAQNMTSLEHAKSLEHQRIVEETRHQADERVRQIIAQLVEKERELEEAQRQIQAGVDVEVVANVDTAEAEHRAAEAARAESAQRIEALEAHIRKLRTETLHALREAQIAQTDLGEARVESEARMQATTRQLEQHFALHQAMLRQEIQRLLAQVPAAAPVLSLGELAEQAAIQRQIEEGARNLEEIKAKERAEGEAAKAQVLLLQSMLADLHNEFALLKESSKQERETRERLEGQLAGTRESLAERLRENSDLETTVAELQAEIERQRTQEATLVSQLAEDANSRTLLREQLSKATSQIETLKDEVETRSASLADIAKNTAMQKRIHERDLQAVRDEAKRAKHLMIEKMKTVQNKQDIESVFQGWRAAQKIERLEAQLAEASRSMPKSNTEVQAGEAPTGVIPQEAIIHTQREDLEAVRPEEAPAAKANVLTSGFRKGQKAAAAKWKRHIVKIPTKRVELQTEDTRGRAGFEDRKALSPQQQAASVPELLRDHGLTPEQLAGPNGPAIPRTPVDPNSLAIVPYVAPHAESLPAQPSLPAVEEIAAQDKTQAVSKIQRIWRWFQDKRNRTKAPQPAGPAPTTPDVVPAPAAPELPTQSEAEEPTPLSPFVANAIEELSRRTAELEAQADPQRPVVEPTVDRPGIAEDQPDPEALDIQPAMFPPLPEEEQLELQPTRVAPARLAQMTRSMSPRSRVAVTPAAPARRRSASVPARNSTPGASSRMSSASLPTEASIQRSAPGLPLSEKPKFVALQQALQEDGGQDKSQTPGVRAKQQGNPGPSYTAINTEVFGTDKPQNNGSSSSSQ